MYSSRERWASQCTPTASSREGADARKSSASRPLFSRPPRVDVVRAVQDRPPPRRPDPKGEREGRDCEIFRQCEGDDEFSHQSRPQIGRDHPLNLSISLSGGKETNQDSPSSGE